MRRYFKTIVKIEVLSEEAPVPEDLDLGEISEEITVGPWSGGGIQLEVIELTAKQAVEELMKQGSDPSFFRLNDDGTEREEE